MLLLLLIQDCDAALSGFNAGNSPLNKLNLRLAQNLSKRATKDALIGGKLMEPGAYSERVRFVNQRNLDRLMGHFAG
jgi:hypothetical protein